MTGSEVNLYGGSAEDSSVVEEMGNRDIELELTIYHELDRRFPYFFIIIRPDLGLDYVSGGSEDVIGLTAEEILACTIDQLVHPEDLETAVPMALEMMSTGVESIHNPSAAHNVEIPIRIGTSEKGWCAMMLSGRVLDESGRILCVLRPNGERHALDKVLRMLTFGGQTGADLRSTLDAVLDLLLTQFPTRGAVVSDADGDGIISCGEVPLSLGRVIHEVGTKWDTTIFHDSDGCEYWGLEILGDLAHVDYGRLLMIAPRPGGPSPYDALVMRGTADLVRLSFARMSFDRMLTEAANTDHLTGVFNRRAAERHLESIDITRDLPVAMLFIDLDAFKDINDKWGHSVGDEVLRRTARRVASTLRDDDLIARIGGDEFVVVCRGMDVETVSMVSERITDALDNAIEVNGVLIPISASIGTAVAHCGTELEDLLHRSDLDMYRRKTARQSQRLFDNV